MPRGRPKKRAITDGPDAAEKQAPRAAPKPPLPQEQEEQQETAEDEDFEPGCFAFGKIRGFPWWPCVVYNDMSEVPVEVRGGHKRPNRDPKPNEIVALFIEPYQFAIVRKDNVKCLHEVNEAELLAGVTKEKDRRKLKEAIESMKEMLEDEDDGKEGGEDDDDELSVDMDALEDDEPEPTPTPTKKRAKTNGEEPSQPEQPKVESEVDDVGDSLDGMANGTSPAAARHSGLTALIAQAMRGLDGTSMKTAELLDAVNSARERTDGDSPYSEEELKAALQRLDQEGKVLVNEGDDSVYMV